MTTTPKISTTTTTATKTMTTMMTAARLTRNFVLVAIFASSFAVDGTDALPTISMHNDLIGNHFALPHSDISNKARTPHFPPFAFEAHPKPIHVEAQHHQQQPQPQQHHQQQQQHQLPSDWWKKFTNDDNHVEESRHVRSQLGEFENVPHLKADLEVDQLPLDLMMLNSDPMMGLDYSDFPTDGGELSPEDQEFLLNQLAEGLELERTLQNLIKQNHGSHNSNINFARRRRSPISRLGSGIRK